MCKLQLKDNQQLLSLPVFDDGLMCKLNKSHVDLTSQVYELNSERLLLACICSRHLRSTYPLIVSGSVFIN